MSIGERCKLCTLTLSECKCGEPEMADIEDRHAGLVYALKKDPKVVLLDLDSEGVDLIHMAMGISGEAGEIIDAIKKATIYRIPIDMDNIIEELGDLEFYMEGLRQRLSITREETLQGNIDKLEIRYKSGYSDEAAKARADKADES